MELSLKQFVQDIRRSGTPLAVIESSDQYATIGEVSAIVNGQSPKIQWDFIRGTEALGATEELRREADKVRAEVFFDPTANVDATVNNPVALLAMAAKLPERAVLFMVNAQSWIEGDNGVAARQALHNLRDALKANGATLFMLAPRINLAPEIVGDVEIFNEPLPDRAQLEAIVTGLCEEAEIPLPDAKQAVDALVGLSAFRAEQVAALAARKTGLDIDTLWERKKQAVSQTPGLSVDKDTFTFDDIGGHNRIKQFGKLLFNGPEPPAVVIRVEEIEKVMGGASGDTSGTSQDALQVLLSGMEDWNFGGIIAYGPPGSGKSLFSKALANTFSKPCISLDLNATKGSLVGSSEARVRQAFGVITAIAGKGGAFFVATANKLSTVPPELRRRFRYGVWMFDLPTPEERAAIWKLNLDKYGLAPLPDGFDDEGYSGADIRSICELAWRCGVGVAEARGFITLSRTNADALAECRSAAVGKYMSSAYEGQYRLPTEVAEQPVKARGGRKLAV